MERGWKEMAPNCPRCGSTNTKFCYYNNYSLTQPRYFCKGCRRYWTKGGSLRNVPVGGGCRKSRRGNKPSLRAAGTTTPPPYPNATPTSCRRTISAFGHVIMSSDGPSSSSSSSASTIDLAVVYANFLNPKMPQEQAENHRTHLPHNHSYHDQLIISPLDQIPSISEANMELGVGSCIDLALSTELSDQAYLEEQGDQLLLLHHHHHQKQQDQVLRQNPSSSCYNHGHVSNGNERCNEFGALLPPLPGALQEEVIPWEKNTDLDDHLIPSSNDHHQDHVESNALQSAMQDPLETGAQFSSLFNIDGCWSPLDFAGYPDIQTPVAATTTTLTTTGPVRQQWP